VIVLAWHNPVLLAEQVATLDLLSGGRLDFGIGKGYRYNEFAGFATPMDDADARFDESLGLLLKAWTSDTAWSHRGRYWQFDNVVVEPPTAQKPHPPLWMGAGSAASIRKVAALGFNLLLDQYASVEQIRERIAIYKAEVEARGHAFDPMRVGVTRSINIVDTPAELERAMENRIAGRRRIDRLAERPDGGGRAQLSDPEIRASALYGGADEVGAMMQRLRDAGAEYVLLNSAGGLATIRRFAKELMPSYSDSEGGLAGLAPLPTLRAR
jgi:alkanesulfonate monooxygenase SsuD/methylene tetrahydromethanopterin reductase-like flavin-dependent oxidoreductase (luciferase family)